MGTLDTDSQKSPVWLIWNREYDKLGATPLILMKLIKCLTHSDDPVLSPQMWVISGTVTSILGYAILLLVKVLPLTYFLYCQIICGIFGGMGG
jgi:hypothetical protein